MTKRSIQRGSLTAKITSADTDIKTAKLWGKIVNQAPRPEEFVHAMEENRDTDERLNALDVGQKELGRFYDSIAGDLTNDDDDDDDDDRGGNGKGYSRACPLHASFPPVPTHPPVSSHTTNENVPV